MIEEKFFREDIQGLRAVAVLAVVLFHAQIKGLSGGYLGVDVFFVISGYLITRNIKRDVDRGSFSLVQFYTRRASRLFPALLATLSATTIAAAFLLSTDVVAEFGPSLASSVFSVANIWFWLGSGYFDGAAIQKPLLHTWSLSVEEQFYLLWPALLLIAFRVRQSWVVILAAGALSYAALVLWRDSTSATFFLTPFRVFQFAAGALLVWTPKIQSNKALELLLISGLGIIIYSTTEMDGVTPQIISSTVVTCATALVLLGGRAKFSGALLRNPVATYIGHISYSIYLVHWPVVVFSAYYIGRGFFQHEKLAVIIASIVLGAALSHTIERPFRQRKAALLPINYWARYGLTAVAVMLVGISATSTGWSWRLGESGESLALIKTDGEGAMLASYGGNGCDPKACTTRQGPPDVIVIGDSHSRHYFAGFRDELAGLTVQFFEFSICPFYSTRFTRDFRSHPSYAEYSDGCREARRLAFQTIASSAAAVVVGQYWDYAPLIDEATGVTWQAQSPDELARFVAGELADLKSDLGVETLFVIGNVPTTGSSSGRPIDCMGRPPITIISCESQAKTDSLIGLRAMINAAFKAELVGVAEFIDPFDALCEGEVCHSIADNMPLYSDSTHLSALGARKVMSVFAPVVLGRLGRQP